MYVPSRNRMTSGWNERLALLGLELVQVTILLIHRVLGLPRRLAAYHRGPIAGSTARTHQ
jgi:hypothetical protein